MNDPSTHVLMIEDNPGDADLVRLRLVESKSPVDVSCVDRLSDGLASLAKQPPSTVRRAAGPESSRQSGSGDVSQGAGEGAGRADRHPVGAGR